MHTSQIFNIVVSTFFLFLPESEVFLEEFDDGLGISEVVLTKIVDLVESGLQRFIGQDASFLVVFHDFIVENREVEGQSELDGVAGWEIDGIGFGVGLECLLFDLLQLVSLGSLGNVSIVISYHLHEKCLGLVFCCL